MFFNSPSSYQPYSSLGSLSMVSLAQIQQEENLDYLENLCNFIDQMNLNPLWFESENPSDKLKILEIYQTAINYSKNLSQAYHKEIYTLKQKTKKMREDNEEKEKSIRDHKVQVGKLKTKIKIKKHKVYKVIYKNLKEKLREEEEQRKYQRRDHEESRTSSDRPEIVYIPIPQPYSPYPPPTNGPANQFSGYPMGTTPLNYPLQQQQQQPQPQPQSQPQPQQHPQPQPQSQPQPGIGFSQIPNLTEKLEQIIKQEVSNNSLPSSGKHEKPSDVLNTRKIDKSVVMENSEFEEQKSDIIKKGTILDDISTSTKEPEFNLKSKSIKRKVSIDKADDFGELAERSRKSSNVSGKLIEGPDSNSSMGRDIDSIVNLKLDVSGKNLENKYESKISKLKNTQKPVEPMTEIVESTHEDIRLTLPEDSKFHKNGGDKLKVEPNPSPQKSAGTSSSDIGISKLQVSKYSADKPKEESSHIYSKPPKRNDKKLEVPKQQHDSDDGFFQDVDLLANSNAGKQSEFIADLKNSNRISRLSGNQGDEGLKNSNQKLIPDKPNNSQLRGSEDYSNIARSNVGQSNSSSEKEQKNSKLFKNAPVRADKKEEINQEESYKNDFDDFDPVNLESSHYPKSSEPSEKSAVSIKAQPVNSPSPYFKIKNQEFKLKLKESIGAKTEKNKTDLELSEDPFDFIDQMPAISVIAKRPKISPSQVLPKAKNQGRKTSISLQKVPELSVKNDEPNNYSINLIEPNKDEIKLLSRKKQGQEVKKSDTEMIQLKGALASIEQPNENQVDLIKFEPGTLESKKPYKKKHSLSLENNKGFVNPDQVKPGPKAAIDSQNEEELNLYIEEETNSKVDPKELKLKILRMVSNANKIQPYKGDLSNFQMNKVDQTLKNICKFDSREKPTVAKIQEMKQLLEREMKRVRVDLENKKNRVEQALTEEKSKLQTPPKLNSPINNDSLLYSYSHLNEKPKSDSRKVKKDSKEAIPDFAESVQFLNEQEKRYASRPVMSAVQDNPYTPNISKTPLDGKIKSQVKEKQGSKANNDFLIGGNKTLGSKEQEQIVKNASEGISKFDKDDPLNLHVGEFVENKKKKTEEEYDEDDDWA